MRVVVTSITPWFPDKVRLQWDLEVISSSGVFHFDIERSGSPGGPWTKVEEDLEDTYLYDDTLDSEEVNVMSLGRDLYYRILAKPPTGDDVYSDPINLDGLVSSTPVGPEAVIGYRVDTDNQFEVNPITRIQPRPRGVGLRRLLRRKILRDEYILFKKLAGIEFYLLKRRHFGTRCAVCYDPVSRSVTKSICTVCYGTSWQGGYFTPMPILGRRLSSQIQSAITERAKIDINQTGIQFLDFPRIDEEDVLVEKAHNRRFLVRSRAATSLKTIQVHQTIMVSELERQAVEYKVPVNL